MHTDRCGNTCRQKCCAKGSGKEVKIQEFMYIDTTNVEPEMYDYTGNNWSHWNSNEKLKDKFGSCTRKTFDRFITKDSYTWNITHNTESTAVWSLKPERWGLPLVQEKYQGEKKKKLVTRDIHIYNNKNVRYPYKIGKQVCIHNAKYDIRYYVETKSLKCKVIFNFLTTMTGITTEFYKVLHIAPSTHLY